MAAIARNPVKTFDEYGLIIREPIKIDPYTKVSPSILPPETRESLLIILRENCKKTFPPAVRSFSDTFTHPEKVFSPVEFYTQHQSGTLPHVRSFNILTLSSSLARNKDRLLFEDTAEKLDALALALICPKIRAVSYILSEFKIGKTQTFFARKYDIPEHFYRGLLLPFKGFKLHDPRFSPIVPRTLGTFISSQQDIDESVKDLSDIDHSTTEFIKSILIRFLHDPSTATIGICYLDTQNTEHLAIWNKSI